MKIDTIRGLDFPVMFLAAVWHRAEADLRVVPGDAVLEACEALCPRSASCAIPLYQRARVKPPCARGLVEEDCRQAMELARERIADIIFGEGG